MKCNQKDAASDRRSVGSMHIHHVVSSILEVSGGPAYSVPGLARAQAAAGASISVFSVGDGSAKVLDDVDFRSFRPLQSAPSTLARLGRSRDLARALSMERADVIHSHGLWQFPGIYAARVAKRQGVPFVVAPRGMMSSVALKYSAKIKWVFSRLVQDRALDQVAMFHATAESEYEDIRALGFRQPVAVVPNGIELPVARLEPVNGARRTLLSLGRIHPKKGLDTLIRAWKALEPRFPDWDLRIVGPDEGGFVESLRDLVVDLGLERVTLAGPAFGAGKWDEFRAADLFALPTRSENFAVSVAESLSVGVPVVSTRGAPWEGLETHRCGWWIDHGEAALVAALVDAMGLVAEERHAMGQRGRNWMAQDFSWNKIAVDMIAAYQWSLFGGEVPSNIRVE